MREYDIIHTMKINALVMVTAAAVSGCAIAAESVATAEFDGNAIRLYDNPLSYEVSRGGVVLVPRTSMGLCINGECFAEDAKLVAKPSVSALSGGSVATPCYKKSSVALNGVDG